MGAELARRWSLPRGSESAALVPSHPVPQFSCLVAPMTDGSKGNMSKALRKEPGMQSVLSKRKFLLSILRAQNRVCSPVDVLQMLS